MPAVVKSLRYIQAGGTGAGRAKAHVRYIQYRPGDEREKDEALEPGGRDLFDGDREHINRAEINNLIDMQKDGVVLHKLVLSPGIHGVDMKQYTRETMAEFGRSKGQNLKWAATIHQNTDHDHAHVVILGRDKDNHRVKVYRGDHEFLRQTCDRFLEREHALDRDLEKELQVAERMVQEKNVGTNDRPLDTLLGKNGWDGELEQDVELEIGNTKQGVAALPDKEKIVVQGKVYSKYSSSVELKALDQQLKKNKKDRIDRAKYALMHRWIDVKAKNGDDCYTKWDKERSEKKQDQKLVRWNKDQAINGLPDRETILARGQVYTKFNNSKELIGLDSYLKENRHDRIEKQQYKMLHSWIKDKQERGEDFHEKQAQGQFARTGRHDFKPLNKASKQAYDDREGFVSRYFTKDELEHQGRTLDFHTIYANNMAKQRLIEAGNRNPELKHVYERELQELRQHSQEAFAGMEKVDLDKLFGANERAREEKRWDYKFDLDKDVEDMIDLRQVNIESGLKQVKPDQDPFASKEPKGGDNADLATDPKTSEEAQVDKHKGAPDKVVEHDENLESQKKNEANKQTKPDLEKVENDVHDTDKEIRDAQTAKEDDMKSVENSDDATIERVEEHNEEILSTLKEQKEQRQKIKDAKLLDKEKDGERDDDEHER